jgi:putative phosphoesterase
MRIAFISDIHGNFTAFKAVLADLNSQNVDQIISLGDTITLGPQPLEVLAKLKELNCVYIKGNHDWAILNPEQATSFQITDHLVPDLLWCKERLAGEDLDFIRSFRDTYEFTFPNGVSVMCFHGSPHSPIDLIQSITPPEDLAKYFDGQTADVFMGGHSHIQMHRRHGDKLVLNSGSVGNAFIHAYEPGSVPGLLPWAEYAILSQNGGSLDVDLRRVYFDTEELLKIVAESGLPGTQWWLKQYQKVKVEQK